MVGGIHGADSYPRGVFAGIMVVEITGMQHKGMNGNVHNHTDDRLHVCRVSLSGTLAALLFVKGVSIAVWLSDRHDS